MVQQGLTVREAAEQWVDKMDAISTGMIAKLIEYEPGDWKEVTIPAVGDMVYVYDTCEYGTIRQKRGSDEWLLELDSGMEAWLRNDDFEVACEGPVPTWSTMWSFNNPCDVDWLENMDGVQALSDCGFRVFYSEQFGYFFGIDGGGYSFLDEHWVPLYLKRGLQWHDPETLQVYDCPTSLHGECGI